MADSPRLRYLSGGIDQSLAVALDLTSYISASRVGNSFLCCRPEEPRHALDQLTLAWLQGNRQRMEEALGPRGRLALSSLMARRSWLELRSEIWHGVPSSGLALGFRFVGSSDWSKPEETLDQGLQDRRRSVDEPWPEAANLITEFVGIAGRGCGSREISFVRSLGTPAWLPTKYLVDEPDLVTLLRTVSDCAGMGAAQ